MYTGPYPAGGSRVVPVAQEQNRKRVLMASRRGTSAFVKPGDNLRIGTHEKMPINKWNGNKCKQTWVYVLRFFNSPINCQILTLSLLPSLTGCPVIPDHKLPVRWDYNSHTLKEVSGSVQTQRSALGQGPSTGPLQYRMLVGGRVLEVNTLQMKFSGRYRCQTLISSTRQTLSAWIYIHTEG